eukprot:g4175.t1
MTGREPARFSIHTALNVNWTANANQGQADFLPPTTPTVTSLLQASGYRVGHFGKWHLGSGAGLLPNGTQARAPLPAAYGIDDSCTFNSNDPCQADGGTGNSSIDIVSRAEGFLRGAKAAGAPFYLNLWLHVSHARLDPTQQMKAAAAGDAHCRASELATNQTECAQLVFAAAQRDADAQLGHLQALLGELDLHESTLVLFSTDNGPEEQLVYSNAQGTTGPFRGRKRSLYEGGTRHTPLGAVDWLPTVAALAGVALPPALRGALDGEDVSRVLLRTGAAGQQEQQGQQRPPLARRTRLFWEWRYGVSGPCENVAPQLAVRDGPWKLLCDADGSRTELYRLDLYNGTGAAADGRALDFHERHNVAAAFPQRAAALKAALLAWRRGLPAPCTRYASSTPCEHFESAVYPALPQPRRGGGPAEAQAQAQVRAGGPSDMHDSEPDFWVHPATGRAMFW